MQRYFWICLIAQGLMIVGFVVGWPESRFIWSMGVAGYLLSSGCLMYFGIKIGKFNSNYYLITVASTSFNWALFGLVGALLSFLIGMVNLSSIL